MASRACRLSANGEPLGPLGRMGDQLEVFVAERVPVPGSSGDPAMRVCAKGEERGVGTWTTGDFAASGRSSAASMKGSCWGEAPAGVLGRTSRAPWSGAIGRAAGAKVTASGEAMAQEALPSGCRTLIACCGEAPAGIPKVGLQSRAAIGDPAAGTGTG